MTYFGRKENVKSIVDSPSKKKRREMKYRLIVFSIYSCSFKVSQIQFGLFLVYFLKVFI